jgi:S-formylglutathione hydrolase FrmB
VRLSQLLYLALLVPIMAAGQRAGRPETPPDRSPGIPPADATLNRGRILLYRLDSPAAGSRPRSVRVCLPRSYGDPAQATRRYPLVVLLHGWPGGDGNWPGQGRAVDTLDSLSAQGRIPEVIALMPNGGGSGLFGRSLYLNSFDGKMRLEDFIAFDLVQWADSSFRTRADSAHRAVIGLSEGATAALNIAFKHPGVFGACGGLSGQYLVQRDIGMKAVFGPEPTATRMREANSPTLLADSLAAHGRHPTIYFDCGLSDGELEDNRHLHHRLLALGIPHTYGEYPGHHGWSYWRTHLRDALIACLAGAN